VNFERMALGYWDGPDTPSSRRDLRHFLAHTRAHQARAQVRADRSISDIIDLMNQRIASACAMPLRVLAPDAWRAKRRHQRRSRKARARRKARRGY
jgi:hypothetical protein